MPDPFPIIRQGDKTANRQLKRKRFRDDMTEVQILSGSLRSAAFWNGERGRGRGKERTVGPISAHGSCFSSSPSLCNMLYLPAQSYLSPLHLASMSLKTQPRGPLLQENLALASSFFKSCPFQQSGSHGIVALCSPPHGLVFYLLHTSDLCIIGYLTGLVLIAQSGPRQGT